jgi:hypothetical protein
MSAREPEPLFDIVERAVEPRLEAMGYAATKREHHPNAFGSRFTVFSSGSGTVRLTWDGQSRSMILRVYKKRNPLVNMVTLFWGKYDLDKMIREVIVKPMEWGALSDGELQKKFTDALDFN